APLLAADAGHARDGRGRHGDLQEPARGQAHPDHLAVDAGRRVRERDRRGGGRAHRHGDGAAAGTDLDIALVVAGEVAELRGGTGGECRGEGRDRGGKVRAARERDRVGGDAYRAASGGGESSGHEGLPPGRLRGRGDWAAVTLRA